MPADPVVLRLESARADAQRQVGLLSRDLAAIVEASALVANDDEHDPEGATIAFERAQMAALLDSARAGLAELEQALERVQDGSYGRCQHCGRPIAPERLQARPGARWCVACAQTGR